MNFTKLPNQELYVRLWSMQLIHEFEQICWSHGVSLSVPAIEITQAHKTYGCWLADSKTIRISAHLIINHPWPVTINVLKHEIAHQICSEYWRSREVAHGDNFQQACHMLGVPTEFRSASGDLPEKVDTAAPNNNDHHLLKKVEKLMALATSANEHEAAQAMSKANQILIRYNLDLPDKNRQYTYAVINRRRKRIEGWQRRICVILRDFFFVQTILTNTYDPLSDQTFKTIEILGLAENVEVAEYCYHFLAQKIDFMWQQNRQQFCGSTRTEKNSFYLGLLQGFYSKLENAEQRQNNLAQSANLHEQERSLQPISSLTTTNDEGLGEFVGQRHPRLRNIKRSGPKIYKETYEQGKQQGKKIVLHKGVSQQSGKAGLQLGT